MLGTCTGRVDLLVLVVADDTPKSYFRLSEDWKMNDISNFANVTAIITLIMSKYIDKHTSWKMWHLN